MQTNSYPTSGAHNHTSNHSHPKKKAFGSLRRRIQAGMFYSTLLAMVILLCLLVPILYGLTVPLSALFSHSVSGDIYARLDTMLMGGMGMEKSYPKDGPNIQKLGEWDLEAILSYADTMYQDKSEFELMQMDKLVPDTLMVGTLNEDVHKMVVTAILSAFSDFEKRFPVRNIINQDLILIEYADASNNKILCIPINTQTNSIERYMVQQDDNTQFLNPFFDHSKAVLTLVDEDGNTLGTIITAINPQLIYGLVMIILVIIGIAILLTLPLITLLIKFHAKNILRPVDQLNKQMASLAQNDFYGIYDFHFNVKRPPNELVELMASATQIMERMNDQNQELDAQKQELEAQNVELEAQNIALTESKETIQDQQDQLVRSEKMATLGQISAAIAHEINTPLGAIKSNMQMMQMLLETVDLSTCNEGAQKKLSKLTDMSAITNDAANRMSEIIKSLKNFSRIDQADFQTYNPVEGIQSVLVLTSNLWKNKIDIKTHFNTDKPLDGYASLLNQVLMNIVVNAIHAMPQGGTLDIETEIETETGTETEAKTEDRVAAETYVIRFKDSGTGIPEDHLRKIFESGFTTKDASMGTGLGLAISKGIIEKHKGQIYAYNNPDRGATFVVKLPLSHPQ